MNFATKLTRRALLGALVLTTGFGLSATAQAKYPDKPIKIIVGFAAGGPTDIVARLVANRLDKILGQPVIVENKPGGGSNIASAEAARAKPDGYTLFLGTIANATNMSVYKNLSYDTERDFVPITQLVSSPSVLVVNNDLPVKTLAELIAYAKANPGKLSYASSGAGGSPHLAGEMLKQRAGIDALHVPYKGAAPAMNDVMGGTVSMGFKTASGVTSTIQAGRLRAIAIASGTRLPQLPDVPTLAELGFKDFEVSSWSGLFAPKGTPPEIINTIAKATIEILNNPDVRKQLEAMGAIPVGSTPAEFQKYVRSEIEKWAVVAKAANIQL
ncbi:Bug family tripartite tricarboxylate transporter substrate binding protein [Zwartia vadi]|uniref:Bug family tripartite tricarboxylate transporter substrate binding protein n=1 Tax=Zwartia vadi TaxID=3058168 RepID=UPI0025B33C9E|nr:tripartite tricarboxylate transporter substrate binding protein [Zwartia vadi]MDN3988285.1 tripartite tricarboxylate transporter substrate binding protein [Zwartia vadi]